ncbi:MAG: glycoside hydrolase family protein [uncultured bacterium (gcode 4)]|uniref:Glycoside hydrolase family protein n=1 Tax=uncultured bacterium (gcode 4) TaxID=1234023 RepID=K2FCI3_9BACT|nr:MAG: glycoside hydrolase family protein [uncultured bacterium (gcode 4)]
MKKFLSILLLLVIFPTSTLAFQDYFLFWLRLQDNEYDIAKKIESNYNIKVPLISVIYDDFNKGEIYKLATTFKELWKDRVYHVDVNPFWYSLKDLLNDPKHHWWETKYRTLFRLIKKYDVKVIFRFLHEMNWWWYSWSSDPVNFPIFWKMVWKWSREEWLDRSNILFDYSINSQDLPVAPGFFVDQLSEVVNCTQDKKKETWCLTFEDYYPGDEYVDIMGVTIYNWWKWARAEKWASWRTPMEVLNEPWYWTFDRMKKFGKPIFIDEAWTTSVNIDWEFDNAKLIESYNSTHIWQPWIPAFWTKDKNKWISQLTEIYTDPQVIGWAYFNADVTYGFTDRSKIWELDWTAIDPDKNFAYPSLIRLFNDKRLLRDPTSYFNPSKNILESWEWITDIELNEIQAFISKYMVFQYWNLSAHPEFSWTLKYPKYQLQLMKYIWDDPVLCPFVSAKFPKIKCSLKVDKTTLNDKKKIFGALIRRIDSNPESLTNWWIWEQTQTLKWFLNINLSNLGENSQSRKSLENMVAYLDFYENRYLDLR